MPKKSEQKIICPFCDYQFILSTKYLVVTCVQCLKRFVPEFKEKKKSNLPESGNNIIQDELERAEEQDETVRKPLFIPSIGIEDAEKTIQKPLDTINIPEDQWNYPSEDKKSITALPIFEDQDDSKQGLILNPIEVTSFQTHFETEVNALITKANKTDILEKEQLEGNSIVGQILFKIEKKIAEGGMGTVYRAKMICADGFEKTVALKTLRPKYAQDPKLLSMFVSEARVMAELKHHNIAAIHSFGKFKGLYFYVMEYIEGRDLYAFQKKHQKMNRKAPLGILVYIIAQVCNALNYVHTKKDNRGKPLELIHRDISPQNIMFSADGVVKVMDFGVAKGKSIASSHKKALAGKLNYTAPEIALFKEVDHRADIYSLGVVFYELITGKLPFNWDNPVEMNQNIEKAEFAPPSKYRKIPEDLEKIILRAMAKNPSQRWADAATMAFALNRFLYTKGLLFNEQTLGDYLKGIFKNLGKTGIATSEKEDLINFTVVRSCVDKKIITREQLTECLRVQSDYNSRGGHMNICAVLVLNKFLTTETFRQLLNEQGVEIARCEACGNQYYISAAKMHEIYDCQRCASPLKIQEKLESVVVDGHFLDS